MKKYMILFVLFIPVLFFTGWIYTLSVQVENAELVQVPLRGYDPRDLLSGHYIQYTIDTRNFDKKAHPQCQLPDTWKAQRFYIPEENAERLDNLFRRSEHRFSILFACQKGRKAIAKQLLIDDLDWHDFIRRN